MESRPASRSRAASSSAMRRREPPRARARAAPRCEGGAWLDRHEWASSWTFSADVRHRNGRKQKAEAADRAPSFSAFWRASARRAESPTHDRARHRPRHRRDRLRRGRAPGAAAGGARRRRDRHRRAQRSARAAGSPPSTPRGGELLDEHRPDGDGGRGPLLRRERPQRAGGRPGPRRRAARRRPARHRRASPTRPSRSRARCAAAAAPTRPRSSGWCGACSRCPSRPSPTMPPTRSPSRSAMPTARRRVAAGGGGAMIALVRRRGRGPPGRPRAWSTAAACGYRLAVSAETLRHVPRGRASGRRCTPTSIVRDDALHLLRLRHRGGARPVPHAASACRRVGPKVALAVLSGGPPRELVGAIAAGDAARFQAVPGIGKRTAERIIVELREKVAGAAGRRARSSSARARRPARARARRAARPRLRAAEADELLDGAPGETPEELIAARAARRARR